MDDFPADIIIDPPDPSGAFTEGFPDTPPTPMTERELSLDHRQLRIIEDCARDRIYFAEAVLGITPEDWQADIWRALDAGETRISIRSGNGAGKTMFCAVTSIHYLLFRNDVKIPITAPAASQLRDGLIPECNKWIKTLPDFLRIRLHSTQDRIVRRDDPMANFISFRTARKETPEALAGIHANNIMAIADEASAVVEPVFEAAQGTLSTAGAIMILIGNPTRLTGFFFQTHHKLKKYWYTKHLTSFDSSRVDQEFIDNIARTYGADSDQYRVKVLGEFPTGSENALIARSVVMAAVNRDVVASKGATRWGVDCGRGGDASTLVMRKRNVIYGAKEWYTRNLMESVSIIKKAWDECSDDDKPESILVDVIGVGAGVADRLRELNLPVVDVNVAESASMSSRYPRLRDEMWFTAKDYFEALNCKIQLGSQLSDEVAEKLVTEMSSPLEIFTASGKSGVESKAQMKMRLLPSPNLADALCHTFVFDHAVAAGRGFGTNKAWNEPIDYHPPHIM